ncbi:MAG: tetratricopeptide repeat protein [Gammaproteobacteria bacterium]|nr:tetratricopeptide repeat protein [Gammaproteobacteria bacterium]MBT8094842.1 tetratricopeptide repeat protein [Gammaproteobacteria bacterium]NNF49045.1 tetratricopeptide repeat protein [Woeseiaceae bacterium]NNL64402.1 tetratricopeptide repeat protein [Woeseiaceae bacterium]
MSLVAEFRHRNVFRVAAAYLVVGWLLTEVLTTILPTLGAPDWASRAVILIFAFGFLPAIVLAWFYEITPDGIKRDHEVDREHAGQRRITRRVDRITIASAVVLIILVGLFSARYAAEDGQNRVESAGTTSVAVLPFVNMSDDADNEYFSDGLTETLLHMLAQVPELKVAARTSSFAFKGQNKSVKDIARALGVAHVLEGSVQRADDRVRVTAQLIRASDGFHVWSEVYDRTLDDIFAIQDEIATKVGSALSASLLGNSGDTRLAGITTSDPDAYDMYLQARKERAKYSYGGLQAAEELLKGALLIDPDFTDAKTELAGNYLHQLETGLLDQDAAIREITAVTDRALAESPDDPVARSLSLYAAALSRAFDGDSMAIPDLVEALEAIVASAPSSLEPRILLVRAYTMLQRLEESVPLLQGALSLDPFNPTLHHELGVAYLRLERWDDARAALETSLNIEPKQPNAYTNLGVIAMQTGDGTEFVRQFMKAIDVDPRDHELPGILAIFLYQLGLTDVGDAFRERVLALSPTSEVAYQIEIQRARSLGDAEASIAAARRAVEDDIQDRRFAFGSAVRHLIRSAVRNGRIEEEMAWIDEQRPGIFDVDAAHVPQKFRGAQGVAFDAWLHTLPRAEVLRRLDVLLSAAESLGVDPTQNPETDLGILVVRGETDAAIDVALERVFSHSVASQLDWRETFAQPQFAKIVADTRVEAALRRWEEEEATLRNSVRSYFADLDASP